MNTTIRSCATCAIAVVTLLAAGCASPVSKVRVDKANTDLGVCRTFAWQSPAEQPASFTEQRVREAAQATLKTKGYAIVDDQPDCKVSYVLATHEVAKSKPGVGVGVGGGSGGVGGGIGISLPIGKKKGESGTFTLDVIDTAKNAQIWSGALDATFEAPELTEGEAREVVERVLAEFPDRA